MGIRLIVDTNIFWTPAYISTAAWYDASDTNTITLGAGGVSQWDDKSGNANHATQGISVNQPQTGTNIINGLNSIEFVQDYFQNTTKLTNVRSIFFVSDIIDGSGLAVNVAPVIGEVTGLENHLFVRSNATDYGISIDGNISQTGSAGVNGSTPTTSGPQTGRNIDFGLSIVEKESPLQWYVEWDANVDWDYIGKLVAGGNDYNLIGALGEIIILDSVPSTDLRQKFEGYLAWKWGLQNSLPALHPYKDGRP